MVPVAQIPLVLSGPVVRRVEDGLACVWIALRDSATVELTVYEPAAGGRGNPVMRGTRSTVQVAKNLHVVAVTATPLTSPLRWGQSYRYDLRFGQAGQWQSLAEHGVLGFAADAGTRMAAIVFSGQDGPSFVLPAAQRQDLHLAHGSCRKPHGHGRDALGLLAELIDQAIATNQSRPQQLFLTGDQIYVDDVAEPLAREVLALADWLAGGSDRERVDLGARFGPAALAPGGRAEFIKEAAGLSSDKAASHLVTYLEICAMYLLAWSQVLWSPPLHAAAALEGYVSQLPAVRRVLANVSTYMMFDDHDVTDDWNRSKEWVDRVGESRCGARVIRNALSAYALFQHWGNDPRGFEANTPGARFLSDINGWDGGPGARADLIALTIQVPEAGSPALEPSRALGWGFTLSGPAHLVVALDCRTQRQFTSASAPPGLMNPAALDRAFADLPRDGRPTVVISGTPVLGMRLITWVQKTLGAFVGGDKLDVEAWELDRDAFDRCIDQLAQRQRVVVLSGDVHYGFAASFVGQEPPAQGCRIVNFTSSALLNSAFARKLAFAPGEEAEAGGARSVHALASAGAEAAAALQLTVPRSRQVATRRGTFHEEILEESGGAGPPRAQQRLAGARRRTAVVGKGNFGQIRFTDNEVVQILWTWPEGKLEPDQTEHRAALPPL